MKTPLANDNEIIPLALRDHWGLTTTHIHFIPVGDSAYSYRVETEQNTSYYLKVVDRLTTHGGKTARCMEFSLPLQRHIGDHASAEIAVPIPQYTLQGTLSASHGHLLFALYTFIAGQTLADAYPMSPALLQRIGQTLAALHMMQLPATLQQKAPQDNLTAPFDDSLHADLAAISAISAQDEPYLQQLRDIVWPRREYIYEFFAHSVEYGKKAQHATTPPVICHGDTWGGNIIPSPSGQLVLLDWESAVVAPPERDAFRHISFNEDGISAFDAGYHMIRKEPVRWNAYLLAYYAYLTQLRNLTTWLHNLLHEAYDDMQRANDLEMLGFHCLDRFAGVERHAAALMNLLQS